MARVTPVADLLDHLVGAGVAVAAREPPKTETT